MTLRVPGMSFKALEGAPVRSAGPVHGPVRLFLAGQVGQLHGLGWSGRSGPVQSAALSVRSGPVTDPVQRGVLDNGALGTLGCSVS